MMREAIPGATSQGTLATLEARRGGRDPPRWVSGGTAACPVDLPSGPQTKRVS